MTVIQQKAQVITPYQKTVYTTELSHGSRIILDIKNKKFIDNIQMKMSKGNWFSNNWMKKDILQAVIPKSLSHKYKLGKQYVLHLDSLSSNTHSIKIEVVGVLKNDIFYNMRSSDYLISDDARILIYDTEQLFRLENYFSGKYIYSFLIMLNKESTYEQFLHEMTEYPGVINIFSIEESFNERLERQNPDIVLPIVMAITIFVLLLIISISKNLLDFTNHYDKFNVFLHLGSNYYDFIKIFIVFSLGLTIIPLILGHIVSILSDTINLYYYTVSHIFFAGIIVFILYFIAYTILFIKIKRLTEFKNKNY